MASFLHTLIIYPLYLVIEIIYRLFLKITASQGLSVIGVSVGITLLCLPLYAVAEHWQQVERDVQKKMKDGLDRIKKTFTGDERYMMTQIFYKQHHYSPIMALRSSFGLLIQIPFFMAAYQFLSGLEAIKSVSFLFIKDMGAPDATFYIGSFPVNVLPIAMTLINMAAGIVYTKGLALREKIQVHGMALIFLAILYNSPSGLVLYWTMNNVFSLVKNIFYKLKNPLKTFWICSCAACAAAAVYILFFYTTKKAFKLAVVFALIIVFFAPIFIKAAKKILDTLLKPLIDKRTDRHALFFSSIVLLFVLFGLAIPSSLISSSAAEFTGLGGHDSPFYYIGNTALQSAAIFIFWFSCVYLLFNKRIQTLMAVGAAILSLSALSNAYLFMLHYGDISPTLIFLNAANFKSISIISLLNILALAALFLLAIFSFRIKKINILQSINNILVISLFAIFIFNASAIHKNSTKALAASKKQQGTLSLKKIYHLSKNHPNVILIMIDKGQSRYMQEILNESPDLSKQYSGFVYYDNVVSFNGHTLLGAPPLFGGYEYTPVEMQKRTSATREQKINESQLVLPRLFNETLGWRASVNDPTWVNSSNYCDLSFLEGYDIEGNQTIGTYSQEWYAANPTAGKLDSTEEILKRNLLFFSLFRCTPICLREAIYVNGTYFNTKDKIKSAKGIIDNYSSLDFLPELTEIVESQNGSYISMLNELTHGDFYFEAPDYIPVENPKNIGTSKYKYDGSYHTQMAALKRIGDWLDFLKENDVYDNTRIIITSDHGGASIEDDMEADLDLDKRVSSTKYFGRGHYHPLLMFKDFNTKGDIIQNLDFMTNADAPSMLVNGLIEKPKNPFTQNMIPIDTKELKENGVVITTCDKHQPPYHKNLYKFDIKDNEWWLVKDNVFKADSWKQINEDEALRKHIF